MEYRHLGRAGIRVSELSLGTWVTFGNQLDVNAAIKLLAAAYDGGVNFFDCAEVYAGGKAEEILGEALRRLAWRRSSYLISTKFYWGLQEGINERNTLNRKRLLEGVRGSLARLGQEYVDLIFCHRPDPTTPVEEVVWAMHSIIERGQAFYWGTSEWPAADIVAAIEIAERHHLHKPVMEQPQYNLFVRERFEREYARLFNEYSYASTTWSPLASGMLTGKYQGGIPKESRATLKGYGWLQKRMRDSERLDKVQQLKPVAKELGISPAQLSIAWVLHNPHVSSVITGATSIEQLNENLASAEAVDRLTPEVLSKIDAIFGAGEDPEED